MSSQHPSLALLGTKAGMTRWFRAEQGDSIPVSVVAFEDHTIVAIKNAEHHGYDAVVLATIENKKSVSKPYAGQFKAAGAKPTRHMTECRMTAEQIAQVNVGDVLPPSMLYDAAYVDVQGTTRGKGFAGTIKRHHFKGSDATHGNSKAHRKPGSIGQCQDPGRVFKGKKMAGRLGGQKRTVQGLEVIHVDQAQGIMLIKGAVPGAPGQILRVNPSIKRSTKGVKNES